MNIVITFNVHTYTHTYIHTYTLLFGIGGIFLMFSKEAHSCIYLFKNTVKSVILQNIITFTAALLQSSVSHDPSEIILIS